MGKNSKQFKSFNCQDFNLVNLKMTLGTLETSATRRQSFIKTLILLLEPILQKWLLDYIKRALEIYWLILQSIGHYKFVKKVAVHNSAWLFFGTQKAFPIESILESGPCYPTYCNLNAVLYMQRKVVKNTSNWKKC